VLAVASAPALPAIFFGHETVWFHWDRLQRFKRTATDIFYDQFQCTLERE
jgi:hypothetical protein